MEFPANGESTFYRPDGTLFQNVPPSPTLERDPTASLMERNREEGIEIDAWTSCPAWDGDPLDLDWFMAVLL